MKTCDMCNGSRICGSYTRGGAACSVYQPKRVQQALRDMSITRLAAFLVGISSNCLNPQTDFCAKRGCPLAKCKNCRRAATVMEFLCSAWEE